MFVVHFYMHCMLWQYCVSFDYSSETFSQLEMHAGTVLNAKKM